MIKSIQEINSAEIKYNSDEKLNKILPLLDHENYLEYQKITAYRYVLRRGHHSRTTALLYCTLAKIFGH